MKKIPSLFKFQYEGKNRQILNEVNDNCEWVLNGEGIATQKFDGSCCMFKEGILYKRYDAKQGKTPPEGFIPADNPDPITGHWPGWIKVDGNNPADKYFIEAAKEWIEESMDDWTFELCGPKVNGNPEKRPTHELIPHGYVVIEDCPRTFEDDVDGFNYAQNKFNEKVEVL